MDKREEMYETLKSIANEHNITFECYLGRHHDSGELCVDFNTKEGYVLFAYDRNIETLHFTTKDFDEFKFKVFKDLCSIMGFEFERKNRKQDFPLNNDCLECDTRKIAFEYTLNLLNTINPIWLDKAIPKYEKLLNLHRKNKNVYFDKINMVFKEKDK